MTLAANKLENVRRRVNRARSRPGVTCPASRHVHQMIDEYAQGNEEQRHRAVSLGIVLAGYWKLRAKERA